MTAPSTAVATFLPSSLQNSANEPSIQAGPQSIGTCCTSPKLTTGLTTLLDCTDSASLYQYCFCSNCDRFIDFVKGPSAIPVQQPHTTLLTNGQYAPSPHINPPTTPNAAHDWAPMQFAPPWTSSLPAGMGPIHSSSIGPRRHSSAIPRYSPYPALPPHPHPILLQSNVTSMQQMYTTPFIRPTHNPNTPLNPMAPPTTRRFSHPITPARLVPRPQPISRRRNSNQTNPTQKTTPSHPLTPSPPSHFPLTTNPQARVQFQTHNPNPHQNQNENLQITTIFPSSSPTAPNNNNINININNTSTLPLDCACNLPLAKILLQKKTALIASSRSPAGVSGSGGLQQGHQYQWGWICRLGRCGVLVVSEGLGYGGEAVMVEGRGRLLEGYGNGDGNGNGNGGGGGGGGFIKG